MKKTFAILLALSVVFAVASCDEGTGNYEDLGIEKVYMPQAAINGGVPGDYPVPMDGSKNFAFINDGTAIAITLGVYRSGMAALESFSVDVIADLNATAEKVITGDNLVALKPEFFSLPETAIVPDGAREATFDLVVEIEKLAEAYPLGHNNKFVLVVGVDNPTKYELNKDLNKTIVVIDGATFIEEYVEPTPPTPPAPPTIAGDFTKPECWTVLKNDKAEAIENFVEFSDGMLIFNPDPENDTYGIVACVYQETNLEAGEWYHFNVEIQTSPTEFVFKEDPWGGPIYMGVGFFGKNWSQTIGDGPWKSGWDKDYRGVENTYTDEAEGISNSFLWLDMEGEKSNSGNALYSGTGDGWKNFYDVDSWRQPEPGYWKDQGNFIAQDATSYVFIWVTQRVKYANPIKLRNITIEKLEQ